jgi:hypothetical protein
VEIAEPSNYNFILRFEIDKMLVRFAQMGTGRTIIADEVVEDNAVEEIPAAGTAHVETAASAVRPGRSPAANHPHRVCQVSLGPIPK